MVFQDPFSSLNPRQTVGDIITAGPRIYGEDPQEARARAAEMLRLVGLNPQTMNRLPHEFSGGQRQRIGLARALMLKPDVLIADEPVSALDVTVQAQVLQAAGRCAPQMNLAMLFITHDMRVAAQVCHRVMVMRHGKVVETGPTRDIFAAPVQRLYPGPAGRHSRPRPNDLGERHAHRHRRVQAGNQQFRALHHHGEDLRGTVSASRR